MVGSENSPINYKFLAVSSGAIIQNTVMLKFVPDHLQTEKMCRNAVKKFHS